MKVPRWWHVHRDPDWQVQGVHRYEQCRCGARRASRAFSTLDGPSRADWPTLRDRHGVWRDSSGWQPEPPGGWPKPRQKPARPGLDGDR